MSNLFVVATPIGNLSDASTRMIETLQTVDLVVAEDTRVSGNLLRHFGISKPMTSLHRHNEIGKTEGLIERMLAEQLDVALVTDAGTPAISDPGFFFVQKAAEAGIEVFAIAGPTALAAALSVSGFDAKEFAFYGFLPRERGPLQKKLIDIARKATVAVLHESPHRIVDLIAAVADTLPGTLACVCCDLTKLHEKTIRGPVQEVLEQLKNNPKVSKGEYCVVLDLRSVCLPEEAVRSAASAEAQVFQCLYDGIPLQDVTARLADHGMRKNEAKRAVLAVRKFLEAARLEL